MGEFDPVQEQWTQYIERLTHLFVANGVKDEKKAILTVIGHNAYKLLRSLIAPTVVEKSYKGIVQAMMHHCCPKPSEIVKWSTAVTEFCEYGATTNDMLWDRLVCGINDKTIQQQLFSETELTFEKALASTGSKHQNGSKMPRPSRGKQWAFSNSCTRSASCLEPQACPTTTVTPAVLLLWEGEPPPNHLQLQRD